MTKLPFLTEKQLSGHYTIEKPLTPIHTDSVGREYAVYGFSTMRKYAILGYRADSPNPDNVWCFAYGTSPYYGKSGAINDFKKLVREKKWHKKSQKRKRS